MQTALRTLARRVGALAVECYEAQRRVTALQTSPDRYVVGPDHAPDTYSEFLFRTSGSSLHEPPTAWR